MHFVTDEQTKATRMVGAWERNATFTQELFDNVDRGLVELIDDRVLITVANGEAEYLVDRVLPSADCNHGKVYEAHLVKAKTIVG
jgi:hypothetical protein